MTVCVADPGTGPGLRYSVSEARLTLRCAAQDVFPQPQFWLGWEEQHNAANTTAG